MNPCGPKDDPMHALGVQFMGCLGLLTGLPGITHGGAWGHPWGRIGSFLGVREVIHGGFLGNMLEVSSMGSILWKCMGSSSPWSVTWVLEVTQGAAMGSSLGH